MLEKMRSSRQRFQPRVSNEEADEDAGGENYADKTERKNGETNHRGAAPVAESRTNFFRPREQK